MKNYVFVAGMAALLTSSAMAAPRCAGPACDGTLVLVGTHTGGPGQGIFAAKLDPKTGALTALGLAAEVERPTWLTRDPGRSQIYAVSETGNDGKSQGGVYALAVDRGTGRLSMRSRVASGGGGATNLAYDARLSTVFVANYGGGQVTAIPVARNGTLSAVVSTQVNSGSGPHPRQKSAHAHGVTVSPDGQYVLSPDLGADKVFVYRWSKDALTPAATPSIAFAPGSGPRHLVFSIDGRFVFVDTELTGEVHTLRWDAHAGRLTAVSHVALDAPGYTGTRSAAELATSSDGRFLYVSNRGSNLLHVFAIDRVGGALREIQRIACGGTSPWSFGFDPSGRWLIVTNEASSNLAVFAVDRAKGTLAATSNSLAVPKPVAVTFLP
ncbi:lactonase family protein [Sphingomonas sp. OK281]|uniref:lactonase family protein n=1 Tax=Sphingomonas sp. OK281 TaxID=1881067 RepID=UPI0008EA5B74|nr:lactonase family protein [Sphingomonas sp. OK281]SFO33551.1 6-phosphogluconolactonase [Sphingomonas sp. OK281]